MPVLYCGCETLKLCQQKIMRSDYYPCTVVKMAHKTPKMSKIGVLACILQMALRACYWADIGVIFRDEKILFNCHAEEQVAEKSMTEEPVASKEDDDKLTLKPASELMGTPETKPWQPSPRALEWKRKMEEEAAEKAGSTNSSNGSQGFLVFNGFYDNHSSFLHVSVC